MAHDPVDHPKHYTSHPSGVECIQVTEHMNFCLGNAMKYIWRAGEKGDAVEDLRKARWYLDREIARLLSGRAMHGRQGALDIAPTASVEGLGPPPCAAPSEPPQGPVPALEPAADAAVVAQCVEPDIVLPPEPLDLPEGSARGMPGNDGASGPQPAVAAGPQPEAPGQPGSAPQAEEAAPTTRKKSGPSNGYRTEARRKVLERDWPAGRPAQEILAEMNEMPGPPVPKADRLASWAAQLQPKLRRPGEWVPREALVQGKAEAKARRAVVPASWADALAWAETVDPDMVLKGSRDERLAQINELRGVEGLPPFLVLAEAA